MLKKILETALVKPTVYDLDSLKLQANAKDFWKRISVEWIVLTHFVPNSATRSLYHGIAAVLSFATLSFKNGYLHCRLSLNASLQVIGYSVTILPSFVGNQGFRIISSCQYSEKNLLIRHTIENIRYALQRYSKYSEKYAKETLPLFTCLDKLDQEIQSQGYFKSETLSEMSKQFKSRPFTVERSDLELIKALAHSLSPDLGTIKAALPALPAPKTVELLSLEAASKPAPYVLDKSDYENAIESIFTVMHGDFTGYEGMPPDTISLVSYLASFTRDILEGKHSEAAQEFNSSKGKLAALQERLMTLLELERAKEGCKPEQVQRFVDHFLTKLQEEKTVTLSSGYRGYPAGHQVYFNFHLEKRRGKLWISGEAFNRGGGSETTQHMDGHGRVRVHPQIILPPAPLDEVRRSPFWKVFLELAPAKPGPSHPTTYSMFDFYGPLLESWPGGKGQHSRSQSAKAQYSGTCQFKTLTNVIKTIMNKEEGSLFLLFLYEKILTDYASKEITQDNIHALKETCAHLARRIVKSAPQCQGGHAYISSRLDIIQQNIQDYEAQCAEDCASSWTNLSLPLREARSISTKFTNMDYEGITRGVTLSPPADLPKRLRYYSREASNYNRSQELCILRKGLEELPDINDAIWESDKTPDLEIAFSRLLRNFEERLFNDASRYSAANVGSDDAALLFKAYSIQFKIKRSQIKDPALSEFYLSRFKGVLESDSLNLFRPIHPDYMQEMGKSVDYLLKESKELSAADNISLMKIAIRSERDLENYPHLNYLLNLIKKSSELASLIDSAIRSRREEAKANVFLPITQLDRVALLLENKYALREELHKISGSSLLSRLQTAAGVPAFQTLEEKFPELELFYQMHAIWGKFFNLFGIRAMGGSTPSSHFSTLQGTGGLTIKESFYAYSPKDRYGMFFPTRSAQDNLACQTNLFLETYPGFEKEEAHKLLPVLKREHPFAGLEKKYENQHLLLGQGLEIAEERLPYYEVQNLLSLTTYKDLGVDLIIKHFNRFFGHLKSQTFQTLFHTLLTQVFYHEEGTHNLLSYTAEKHPDHLFELIDFLQKKRSDTERVKWHDTTHYFFWLEGLVLSYLVRSSGDKGKINAYYENYLEKLRHSLETQEARNSEAAANLKTRIFSLALYFENTDKKTSFFNFIEKHVGSAPNSSETQEERRINHTYLAFNGKIAQGKKVYRKKTVTAPFPGTYTHQPNISIEPHIGNSYFPITTLDWDYYISEDKSHGLLFRKNENIPAFFVKNGELTALENGELSKLFLAVGCYQDAASPLKGLFERLANPQDLYLLKNDRGEVVRADFSHFNLSFELDEGCWMSSLHPGYYVDENCESHLFSPASHYLVLRNKEGQRIVYTSSARFAGNEGDKLLLRQKSFAAEKREKCSLLVYHLENETEIDFSKARHEELLYGIYLFMQKGDYEKAALWLKEWEKQKPLHNDATFQILENFEKEDAAHDKNPRTVAVRLKLYLSLLNDPLYRVKGELKEKLVKALVRDRDFYHMQKNHAFPFELPSHMVTQLDSLRLEITCEKVFDGLLPSKEFVGQLVNKFYSVSPDRLTKLLKEVATACTMALALKVRALRASAAESLDLKSQSYDTHPKVKRFTRPGEAFKEHFLYYYRLAKTLDPSDPRIQELHQILSASECDLDETVLSCRYILKQVLEYPYSFPSFEELLSKVKHSKKPMQELITIAENVNWINERVSLVFELISLLYAPLINYAKKQLVNGIGSRTFSKVLTYYVLASLFSSYAPHHLIPGLGKLCQENFLFNLFLSNLLWLLVFSPAEHFVHHTKQGAAITFSTLKRWAWKIESPFTSRAVPKKLFHTAVEFNSQFEPPLQSLINQQDFNSPFIVGVRKDVSSQLATIEDIKETFNTRSKNLEPCVKKRYDQLLEGAQRKTEQLNTVQGTLEYQINPNNLSGLIAELKRRVQTSQSVSDEKAAKILEVAHHYPPKLKLEVQGGLLTPLTLDELIIAFGRDEDEKIQKSNPSLTESDLLQIKQLTGEYLVAKTNENQLAKVQKNLEEAHHLQSQKKNPEEVASLLQTSVELLGKKREYSASKNPHFLVFEYYSGFYLRNDQLDILKKFLDSCGSQKVLDDLLAEAPTGFGKSKVLIPLWLHLVGRSGRIPMITVPEPLVEEMRVHLAKVLGKSFDQVVTLIEFDRTRANDLDYLKYIHLRLREAKREGKCVLISINSLHGLAVLKHKETYFKTIHEGTPKEHLEELSKIRKVLSETVSNFVDEVSDAFYIRYSYDYSVGKKKALPTSYVEVTEELFSILLKDPILKREIDFDFLRGEVNDDSLKCISEESYKNKILPCLIQHVIENFKVPAHLQEAVRKNLEGGYDPKCEEFFKSLTEMEFRKYSIWRKQLTACLKQSLTTRWNERYKLGADRIAYPARNGKLIPRSQFSSLDLILNFTLQANLRQDFTLKDINAFIEELIKESINKPTNEFQASTIYFAYKMLSEKIPGFPANFWDITHDDKVRLLGTINQSIESRLFFVKAAILPRLQYYPKKIVSFPHLLCNRMGQTHGASGTLIDNVPARFKAIFDPTSLFKNLVTVWEKSQDKVAAIPKFEGKALVDYIFKNFNGDFNVILDIAGDFRGFSSYEDVAKEILRCTAGRTNPPIDAVGYFDEQGRNMILLRKGMKSVLKSNASIPKETVFEFYPQEYAIGADKELPLSSKALATVNRFTRSHFFMQGVGRLRALNSGQEVTFIGIQEELEYIKKAQNLPDDHKLQLRDIFPYFFNLEAEKQGDEAFDVDHAEWVAEAEQVFWQADLGLSMDKRVDLFKKLAPLFEKKVFAHPSESVRQTLETLSAEDAAKNSLNNFLKTLEKVVKESPELSSRFPIEKLKKAFQENLDFSKLRREMIQNSQSDAELSFSEVEQELEQEEEQIKFLDRDYNLNYRPSKPIDWSKPYENLSQYKAVSATHPDHKEFISDDLLCTENTFKIDESRSTMHKVALKPVRYSLAIHDRKSRRFKLVLLDLHDANYLLGQMESDANAGRIRSEDHDFYLIGNDQMNLLAANGRRPWDDNVKEDPQFRRLMIQARPYTAYLAFSNSQQSDLEAQPKEKTERFLISIGERFGRIWPYYKETLENLAHLLV